MSFPRLHYRTTTTCKLIHIIIIRDTFCVQSISLIYEVIASDLHNLSYMNLLMTTLDNLISGHDYHFVRPMTYILALFPDKIGR